MLLLLVTFAVQTLRPGLSPSDWVPRAWSIVNHGWLLEALVGLGLLFLFFFSGTAAESTVRLLFARWRRSRRAFDEALDDLCFVLAFALDRDLWGSAWNRSNAMWRLEWVAVAIESILVHPAMETDPESRRWSMGQRDMIAANIRNLKSWILTPGARTVDDLADRVAQLLDATINQEYDRMRIVELELPARLHSAWRRLLLTCRGVIASIIPLATVVGLAVFYSLDAAVYTPLLIGAALFAIVNLVRILDPGAMQSISATQDAMGVFSKARSNADLESRP
jgi:hypothetical protein